MAGAGYRLFTAGQVLTAAQVNTYLMEQSIMQFATSAARDAALTSIKSEGNVTYQLDNNDLDIYNGTSFSTLIEPTSGALKVWTPAVVQSGAVTTTNTASTYIRIGRWIQGMFNLAITSAGVGANVVTVSLPVTAIGTGTKWLIGLGTIIDTSAGVAGSFTGNAVLNSTTTMKFQVAGIANDPASFLGTSGFTAAFANGDFIFGQFAYEAGADA
jgi:hypothetical protein